MKEIGSLLKKEREKKNLTLKEVAVATKISQSTLEAIENGEEATLPAKPFVRGFIQTYARHLGLEVDQVMQMFLSDVGTTKPQIVKLDNIPSADKAPLDFINKKWDLIKKGSIVAGIILFVFFAWFLVETINKYEEQSKEAAERKDTVITQVSTNTVNTDTPTATPTETTPPPPTTPSPAAVAPSATPLVIAPQATPTPTTTPTPKPSPSPSPQTSAPQQIIIEALDKVRVKYVIDDGSSKSVDLKPEQILTLKAQNKISVSLSDGGAVNIIHNGIDLSVPGNLGQPIELSFPK